MLCYFFCTQEIFGSVAPDVQRGVQVSGGIRDTRFMVPWYSLCLVTVASIRRHHQCLYCSHMKDYVAKIPNFYVRVGLLEKMRFL